MPLLIIRRPAALLLTVAVSALLSACGTSLNRAPVEDRNAALAPRPAPAASSPAPVAAAVPETKPMPGAENAGKPGYYTVKPGDKLARIGYEHGQSYKDLARWNNIENPDRIEVGQVLRVVPPNVDAGAVAARPVTVARADSGRPLDAKPAAGAPASGPAGASSAASGAASGASAASAVAPQAAADDDSVGWSWPVGSTVTGNFDEQRNKGLDFAGKAGDAVLAAADGRVIFAGSGLRGYGNLVIIKHNTTYLTAYAHNQALLVKEDQVVRKGQKIAEMGSTESDQVKLHFEVRKQGKPVDPAKLLPAR
jgi:lipoprotein NlpD